MVHRSRSLAEIARNEVVTVRRILFECLQARCAELGVEEGDRLVVYDGDGGRTLVLRKANGELVPCPPDLARFVEVGEEGSG